MYISGSVNQWEGTKVRQEGGGSSCTRHATQKYHIIMDGLKGSQKLEIINNEKCRVSPLCIQNFTKNGNYLTWVTYICQRHMFTLKAFKPISLRKNFQTKTVFKKIIVNKKVSQTKSKLLEVARHLEVLVKLSFFDTT